MELERIVISPLRCASGWVIAEAFGYWWRLWQPGWRAVHAQLIKHHGSGWWWTHCGSQLFVGRHECLGLLHTSLDVLTCVDTSARFVTTKARRRVRSVSMSTLGKDVEALARSTEAQQHRARKLVARRSAGAQLSSTWCLRVQQKPSVGGRVRPRLGSWRCASSRRRYLALSMTPSLSAVWVCAVCVEYAWISVCAVCVEYAWISTRAGGKTGCGSDQGIYNFTSLEHGAWQRSWTKRAICGAATECHENPALTIVCASPSNKSCECVHVQDW